MIANVLLSVRFDVRTSALAWMLLVLELHPERLVITSGSDGEHTPTSAHYRGEAIDVRSHDLETMAEKRARQAHLQNLLGRNFVVLLEPYDLAHSQAAEHLHLQLLAGVLYTAADLESDVAQRWVSPGGPAIGPLVA